MNPGGAEALPAYEGAESSPSRARAFLEACARHRAQAAAALESLAQLDAGPDSSSEPRWGGAVRELISKLRSDPERPLHARATEELQRVRRRAQLLENAVDRLSAELRAIEERRKEAADAKSRAERNQDRAAAAAAEAKREGTRVKAELDAWTAERERALEEGYWQRRDEARVFEHLAGAAERHLRRLRELQGLMERLRARLDREREAAERLFEELSSNVAVRSAAARADEMAGDVARALADEEHRASALAMDTAAFLSELAASARRHAGEERDEAARAPQPAIRTSGAGSPS